MTMQCFTLCTYTHKYMCMCVCFVKSDLPQISIVNAKSQKGRDPGSDISVCK